MWGQPHTPSLAGRQEEKTVCFFPLTRRITLHSIKNTPVRYHSLRSFLMLPPDLDFVLAFIKDAKQPATMEVFTEQAVIL